MYRKLQGIPISKADLRIIDQGREVGQFKAEQMVLVFLDSEYDTIGEVFIEKDAELEQVKETHQRLALSGEGILVIEGRSVGLVNKGRAELRGDIVWELTGRGRQIVLPASSCRLVLRPALIVPKPGSAPITLDGATLTVIWE